MIVELPAATEVLGAMITPAVLISASGTLTLATSNRLGRVVDRVRVLGAEADLLPEGGELTADDAERRTLIADQLKQLLVRIRYLQTAITLLYSAIGLFVGASLSIGLTAALKTWLSGIPVGLGLLGSTALLAASVVLVREARLAVRVTVHEMQYVQKRVNRKTTIVTSERPA